MAQCFSFAKEENMVERCVAFGCSNTKDEIKGISIHQIPFYGDTKSEAVKRRGKWISFVNGNRKHWTPSKYSAVCSVHFAPEDFIRTLAYSFDQQRYQKRLKRAEIQLFCPFLNFIYRTLSKDIQHKIDRRLHRRSVRFISPLVQ